MTEHRLLIALSLHRKQRKREEVRCQARLTYEAVICSEEELLSLRPINDGTCMDKKEGLPSRLALDAVLLHTPGQCRHIQGRHPHD